MINKIIKRGTGKTSAAINYIMGEKTHDGTVRKNKPKIMYGDPSLVAQIGDLLTFKNKYTSGVLSFTKEEKERLDNGKINEIIDSHMEQMAAGIGIDNLPITYVMHDEHEHLEIHYVCANVDLISNNHFNPFVAPRGDIRRFKTWRELMRLTHELDDPSEPSRRRLFADRNNIPHAARTAKKNIHDLVMAQFDNGSIKNREDIILLAEAQGLKLERKTEKSLSFSHPSFKRNFRFNGAIYELKQWQSLNSARATTARARAEREQANIEDIRQLSSDLENQTSRVINSHRNKYKRTLASNKKTEQRTFGSSTKSKQGQQISPLYHSDFSSTIDRSDFLLFTLHQADSKINRLSKKLSDLLTKAKRRFDYFRSNVLQRENKKARAIKLLKKQLKIEAFQKQQLKIARENRQKVMEQQRQINRGLQQ